MTPAIACCPWSGRSGPRRPRTRALVASLSLLLATVVWAADGRTVLEPGWNMFSAQQDVEIGQEVSLDAERQLPMLDASHVDDHGRPARRWESWWNHSARADCHATDR
jgi:hypothetical protein